LSVNEVEIRHIDDMDSSPCWLVDMEKKQLKEEKWQTASVMKMLLVQGYEWLQLIAKGWQYTLFMRTHRFCGQCGAKMSSVDWEMATQCHSCGHRCYPRISPCIIVAITRGNKILLAQSDAQRSRNMHSVLAGFVESGENLEQTLHREIKEEVGIEVQNLRYFGSQPWPFPHSLMIGFLADYKEGEIEVDGEEILEADWYTIDQLPQVPPPSSIAGRLIKHCVDKISQSKQD
jgi:NAD+ diphosphatase